MAYQSLSQLKSPPFFQSLVAQGAVKAEQFSFALSLEDGASELFLGGMNDKLYEQGSTTWYPVTSQSYWLLAGKALVGGKAVSGLSTVSALIDTGTR